MGFDAFGTPFRRNPQAHWPPVATGIVSGLRFTFSCIRCSMLGVGRSMLTNWASAHDVMTAQNILGKLFHGGNSYWLTRFAILRLLGFVYAVAFLIAAQQLVPLVGEHGLTPANHFFHRVEAHLGWRSDAALQLPAFSWVGFFLQVLRIFQWVGL